MKEIKEIVDNCIIVRIPIGREERDNNFEATRRCWRVNLKKAKEVDYVLGIIEGKVLCVIKVEDCNYVSSEFCDKEKNICKEKFGTNINLCKTKKRIEFIGKELTKDTKYLGKKIPDKYIPGHNPVRYTY